MRNDARPIGHGAQDPTGSNASTGSGDSSGGNVGSVTHGRESHIVNRQADERDEDSNEKALPATDATLRTKI